MTSYRQATYVTMGADDSAFSYPADYESSDPLNFILKSDAARGRVTDQRTIEAGKRANQNVEKARADAIK